MVKSTITNELSSTKSFLNPLLSSRKAVFYYVEVKINSKITCSSAEYFSILDYFEFLVSLGPANRGISVNRSYNIKSLADISDFERGIEVTQSELSVMYSNANDHQNSIFNRVNIALINSSVTFVSGAAGTGKSYLLKMFERHYKIEGYKVKLDESPLLLSFI
ncbi:hypothetical protein [Parasitella parasitica]|uniref:ATP-dependent DNA helicase n=1 Tax=Parasitella parasitica TaxID=35722 RepID=A0A0B7NMQ3_9FUNG|nr:hypothetical protein [Parasitella parasitica]